MARDAEAFHRLFELFMRQPDIGGGMAFDLHALGMPFHIITADDDDEQQTAAQTLWGPPRVRPPELERPAHQPDQPSQQGQGDDDMDEDGDEDTASAATLWSSGPPPSEEAAPLPPHLQWTYAVAAGEAADGAKPHGGEGAVWVPFLPQECVVLDAMLAKEIEDGRQQPAGAAAPGGEQRVEFVDTEGDLNIYSVQDGQLFYTPARKGDALPTRTLRYNPATKQLLAAQWRMTLKEEGAELHALLRRLAALARAGGAATDIADVDLKSMTVAGWTVRRQPRDSAPLPLPALRLCLLRAGVLGCAAEASSYLLRHPLPELCGAWGLLAAAVEAAPRQEGEKLAELWSTGSAAPLRPLFDTLATRGCYRTPPATGLALLCGAGPPTPALDRVAAARNTECVVTALEGTLLSVPHNTAEEVVSARWGSETSGWQPVTRLPSLRCGGVRVPASAGVLLGASGEPRAREAEEWDCPRCTLHNTGGARRCEACNKPMPPPKRPARRQLELRYVARPPSVARLLAPPALWVVEDSTYGWLPMAREEQRKMDQAYRSGGTGETIGVDFGAMQTVSGDSFRREEGADYDAAIAALSIDGLAAFIRRSEVTHHTAAAAAAALSRPLPVLRAGFPNLDAACLASPPGAMARLARAWSKGEVAVAAALIREGLFRLGGAGTGSAECPRGHQLQPFETPRVGFTCDRCPPQLRHLPAGTKLYGCRRCNYDVCPVCAESAVGDLSWAVPPPGYWAVEREGGHWVPVPPDCARSLDAARLRGRRHRRAGAVEDVDFAAMRCHIGAMRRSAFEGGQDYKSLLMGVDLGSLRLYLEQVTDFTPDDYELLGRLSDDDVPKAASPEQLALLEDTHDAELGDDGEPRPCCICLDVMDAGNLARLPCKHVFHADCIRSHLKRSKACPCCKREIGS
eukprot:TRINITY_DN14211_c0_g1_i1.p1 TRINITY_DN14211_c0_g1~~TRINITY_DN14211_c0_g1_i1.p1  ORF type:complete len:914 (+),score=208.33 TRINITY_DN14211_c0_g1_i1:227-2968(+)